MKAVIYLVIATIVVSCSPISKKALNKTMRLSEERFHHHAGLLVYDPEKKKTVYAFRQNQYFTPASNTKILTFFTALEILGDSIPALRYVESGDSLIFWGMGDPSFLNKENFNNGRVFNFLSSSTKKLFYSSNNFTTDRFGPGWAWDDYNDYYSPERSAFPIYGNCITVHPFPDRVVIQPYYFNTFYNRGPVQENVKVIRELHSNRFVHYPGTKRTYSEFTIPFRIDEPLVAALLSDTLRRQVAHIGKPVRPGSKLLYSMPADSVYRVMMQVSDNLMAEQLLLMCSAIISDSLKPDPAMRYMNKKYFDQMSDPPVWRDGSGLSRYNLFTPAFLVDVWSEIYRMVPRERLFLMLATTGKSGTLKNWFKDEKPFIYGKTGTLSNNHSLSGYLVTKSGKTLIFSFMNANYTVPTSDIRTEMQQILRLFYENYQ